MQALTVRQDYSQQKEFHYALLSDLHLDSPRHDAKTLKTDLDRAKDEQAGILINGDLFSAILPNDRKRYTKSADKHRTDAKLNYAVEEAVDLLDPYVDLLLFIGFGNHEGTILKDHNTELIRWLIRELSHYRSKDLPPIEHGGYCGFLRLLYTFGTQGRARSYDIYYNHGQGCGNGQTDINTFAQWVHTDLIWIGHKHKRLVVELPTLVSISARNQLVTRQRYGVLTGCYEQPVTLTNPTKNGYTPDYGEERMRTPQVQRGVFLRHTLSRELCTEISL